MADALRKLWGDRWSVKRVVVCWVGLSLALVIFGLIKNGGVSDYRAVPEASGFSRKECIQRHQGYFFERNPDMTELDDDKIRIVARECAVEEREFYDH